MQGIQELTALPDDVFGSYILDSRPSAEFRYDAAKNKLVHLDFSVDEPTRMVFTTPGDNMGDQLESGTGRQGRLLRLAGLVDLESRITVYS